MVALSPTKRIVETKTGVLGKMKLSPTISQSKHQSV